MARILCSDPIDVSGPELLRAAGHQVTTSDAPFSPSALREAIPDYDVLLVQSATKVDSELLAASQGRLQLIGSVGARTANIDLLSAARAGALVVNSPFGSTVVSADSTIGLLSKVSGKSDVALDQQFQGQTLGIVGLGRVGREVARKCTALGMKVVACDPVMPSSSSSPHAESVSFDDLVQQSDFISLHTPVNALTRHLFSKDALAKCKQGVRIVNNSRSALVDLNALAESMEKGVVGGAAFAKPPQDTTAAWKSLLGREDFIVSPTSTIGEKISTDLASKVDSALSGDRLSGVINAPNLDLSRRQELDPFLSLAQRLGSLQGQLIDQPLKRVVVESKGRELTSSEMSGQVLDGVLKGLLTHLLDEEVDISNACEVADDLGVECIDHKHEVDSANVLSVTLVGQDGTSRKVSGTVVGDKQPKLMSINDLQMDALPSGAMLFFNNQDVPGVLHSVTTVLAKHHVNIGRFGLTKELNSSSATSLLNVDDIIPDAALRELETLDTVHNLRRVSLLEFNTQNTGNLLQLDSHRQASGHKKPSVRPSSPFFGSGPCKKRPGYSLSKLSPRSLGRSHRSVLGKGMLEDAIERTKKILRLPSDYHLGIVPASDTGAFEMAMWNLLGPRPVDICYWETFGQQWFKDATQELHLENIKEVSAPFGKLPDLSQVNFDHDVLLTWNGTTSGVKIPNGDWIPDDHQGLIFNDATSAAFAMDIPWHKMDVGTFSWQKVLGGEGAHGMLMLSPRAVERLESFKPENRPMPKIMRFSNASTGKLSTGIFEGSTINTPSMLCVEDYLDALTWSEDIGGLDALIARSETNLKVVEDFVQENSSWIKFLAESKDVRSNTSVCLLLEDVSKEQVKKMTALLAHEGVAFDINSYRDAPPGIRIWCGATVEAEDLQALLPWIKWAYAKIKAQRA